MAAVSVGGIEHSVTNDVIRKEETYFGNPRH